MNSEIEINWRKGDAEMPENVKYVVKAAQDELLLRSLRLPVGLLNVVRYIADKNALTVNEYVSSLILERVEAAQ